MTAQKRIFLSHISEEKDLARVLKEWIETTFGGQCDVFVSSDIRDIPAGARWLDEIEQALSGSCTMLLLCSPTSISRPWVNFEAGCGWIKHIPVMPICHSGQLKGSLPPPISTFQALEINSEQFISDLLASLAEHLKVPKCPRIDQATMRQELDAALGRITPSKSQKPIPAAPDQVQSALDDKAIEILRCIAARDEAPIEKLQLVFHMPKAKMGYYLDRLRAVDFVNFVLSLEGHHRVFVTAKGRKELVDRGLL